MFYAKICAHVVGLLVLAAAVGVLKPPTTVAAICGLVSAAWTVAILAMCVKHWARRRPT